MYQITWRKLGAIGEIHSATGTILQQLFEARGILRARNHVHSKNSRHHEAGERIEDHGFVVNRQNLHRDREGRRIQKYTRDAGQNDSTPNSINICLLQQYHTLILPSPIFRLTFNEKIKVNNNRNFNPSHCKGWIVV